jgi:hypothetical protein
MVETLGITINRRSKRRSYKRESHNIEKNMKKGGVITTNNAGQK